MDLTDLIALVPNTVTVTFPLDNGDDTITPDGYSKSIVMSSLSLSDLPRGHTGTKYLRSTAVRTSSNQTFIDALAQQTAIDWWRWQLGWVDQTLAGVVEWTPEGFHDLEWCLRPGEGLTRVRRAILYEDESQAPQGNADGGGLTTCDGCDVINVTYIDVTNIDVDYLTVNYTANFYETVNFYNEVNLFSTVNVFNFFNFSVGGLCLPVLTTPGPPSFTPTCAAFYWNCADGLLYLWDPCGAGAWFCIQVGTCSTYSGSSGSGGGGGEEEDSRTTCECPQCPDGAPLRWLLHVGGVNDPTYGGLVGDWYLDWVSGCTWQATDGSCGAGTWTLTYTGGEWVLTGETSGGDTVTYTLASGDWECCAENILVLDSSSTGDLDDRCELTLLPIGGCGPCPEPPVDHGSCECELCPDGVPMEWILDVSGFTEEFSGLNGTNALYFNNSGPFGIEARGCVWESAPAGYFPRWLLYPNAINEWVLIGVTAPDVYAIYKTAPDDFNCCDDNTLVLTRQVTQGSGSVPDDLIIEPGTACECGEGGGGGGGGTVETNCCPDNPLPATLYAHFGSGTGGCTCLDGKVVTLTQLTGNSWQGSLTACGGDNTWQLICNFDGTWSFVQTGAAAGACVFVTGGSNIATFVCDPALQINATITLSTCCAGTIAVTILETA